MQKRTQLLSITVGILVLPAIIFYFSACHKNKDCKATITIVSASSGGPVSGATVKIAPNQPSANLTSSAANFGSQQTQTGITDGSGSVSFTFKLPAILSATVTALPTPYTACVTCPALVQLQESQTVSKTIQVQ